MLSPTSFSQWQKSRQPLESKALCFSQNFEKERTKLVKLKLGKQNSPKFPPFLGKTKRKENTGDNPGKIMENKCCMVLKMEPNN
jgi:hypothetical protein